MISLSPMYWSLNDTEKKMVLPVDTWSFWAPCKHLEQYCQIVKLATRIFEIPFFALNGVISAASSYA